DEGEEETVDGQPPGQQADDRADLAADDRADRDADHAPEGDGGEPAPDQEHRLSGGEGEGDAACVECEGADPVSERLADEAEGDPGKEAGCGLGGEHVRASGIEEERRFDRAVAVFTGDQHAAGEGGEDVGDAADVEEAALVLGGRQVRGLGEEAAQEREEDDQADHPGYEPERGAGRADLEQLRADLVEHGCSLAVSWRKTSSSEELSATSSESGTPAAKAIWPTRSLLVPCASSACSFVELISICSRSSAARSRSGSGVRMRTEPVARAVSWASGDSVTRRPWLMISTWSTVCATSASTWLETSTVRPRVAKSRRKSRSQRTPPGARP